MQFLLHALVDEVARFEIIERFRERRVFVRHGDRCDGQLAEIPRGDSAFAVAGDLREAVVVHGRDAGVARSVFRPARDVFLVAVVEERGHVELLRLARFVR